MKKFLVLVAAVCMAYTTAFAQTVKPFKEGDRAVFLGNSITDGGRYHSFIWLYYMTRFPNILFVYSMEVLVVIQRMI